MKWTVPADRLADAGLLAALVTFPSHFPIALTSSIDYDREGGHEWVQGLQGSKCPAWEEGVQLYMGEVPDENRRLKPSRRWM